MGKFMTFETDKLDWAEREARHPELRQLLEMPFDDLLHLTAEELLDKPEPNDEDPTGEWIVNGVKLRFAENQFAVESIAVLSSRRTVAAVYDSDYRGIIGRVIQPVPRWAISVDKDGTRYYWNESQHEGTPGMFVLEASECDLLRPEDPALPLMHRFLCLAVYLRRHPEAFPELGRSTIPPLDLKARIGISD